MPYIDILQATRDMVSQYMSGLDPSHDMYHVDRVRRLGKPIFLFGVCQIFLLTAQI